VLMDVVVW